MAVDGGAGDVEQVGDLLDGLGAGVLVQAHAALMQVGAEVRVV